MSRDVTLFILVDHRRTLWSLTMWSECYGHVTIVTLQVSREHLSDLHAPADFIEFIKCLLKNIFLASYAIQKWTRNIRTERFYLGDFTPLTIENIMIYSADMWSLSLHGRNISLCSEPRDPVVHPLMFLHLISKSPACHRLLEEFAHHLRTTINLKQGNRSPVNLWQFHVSAATVTTTQHHWRCEQGSCWVLSGYS